MTSLACVCMHVEISSMKSSETFETSAVTIPDEWVEQVGGGEVFFNILQEAVECYHVVRDRLVVFDGHGTDRAVSFVAPNTDLAQQKQPIAVAKEYLSNLRQLILSVSSVSTSCCAVFPTDEQRGGFVDFVMRRTVPLLSDSVLYLTEQVSVGCLPEGVTTDTLADICAQECEHLLYILIRLLGG